MASGYARFLVAPLALAMAAASSVDPDANVLLQFTAHPINTRQGISNAPAPFSLTVPSGPALQLVQFTGPIQQFWLDALSAHGITPVQYVASNGYIVWADEAAQLRLRALRSSVSWLQYNAPLYSFLKVDPRLEDRLSANPTSNDEVDVVVQIYAHAGDRATKEYVVGKGLVPTVRQGPVGAGVVDYQWTPVLKFANLKLRVRLADVAAIAERPDVTFVGENLPRKMMDEKQGIILSGDFAPGPASPSYLQFLLDHGFSQTPADYPIVDVTDSTIDEGGSGVTVLHTVDPFLHVQGDLAQDVRVSYFKNCSSLADTSVGSYDGHGSLNAGIVADYDQSTGYPYQDSDGQRLGLGVNPFGRVGSTAIFVGSPESYDIGGCGNSDLGVIKSNWQSGARISTNSWGGGVTPIYDDGDQAYDTGVRDADSTAPGNQEMIYVFAAANAGPSPGTVASPGAGKNVITIGASENLRPFATPGDDGCAPSPANDPESVVDFSSRGPAPGQRIKPEVVAPGTKIQGPASVYSGYNGSGLCLKYYPESPVQQIFTYSSGTSHSTPAVAGVASLAYWWIEQGGAAAAAGTIDEIGGSRSPSPAMMKAWLIAHPTYLTGNGANDTLPSNSQGYGIPNTGDMFSTTPKVLIDQSEVFDNTGETRSYELNVADPTQAVRIALAYTDAPGVIGSNPQVNDLDLAVTIYGETYLGNQFAHQWSVPGGSSDSKNNYEAVFLPPGTTGRMTVTVTAANIAGDGVPNSGDATDQDFALVCNNCQQAPQFNLTVTPSSLLVCLGGEQSTTVHLDSIAGFSDPVTFGASGEPDNTQFLFTPNPAVPPDDATLTVAAGASAAAGNYLTNVIGTSASIQQVRTLKLQLVDGALQTPTQVSPTDGSIDTATSPTLTWNSSPGADTYTLDIATDPDFDAIVQSLPGLTDLSVWIHGLTPMMTYYWRVTALNSCGSAVSAVLSFTTANEICHTPNLAIPDDSAMGVSDSIEVDDASTVNILRLRLRATHTAVGDLKFTLSQGTQSSVVIDRPGYTGVGYGCSGQNIDVLLDDAAPTRVEDQCRSPPPAISGTQQPNSPINVAFAGQPFAGTWILTAADLAPGETGTLDEWCLVPQTESASDTIFEDSFEE